MFCGSNALKVHLGLRLNADEEELEKLVSTHQGGRLSLQYD